MSVGRVDEYFVSVRATGHVHDGIVKDVGVVGSKSWMVLGVGRHPRAKRPWVLSLGGSRLKHLSRAVSEL